jgi:hypothetical protein
LLRARLAAFPSRRRVNRHPHKFTPWCASRLVL